ncbi:MAG: alpha/beta hydrolase fold domain-containing protein [Armatimonadota bacterium]
MALVAAIILAQQVDRDIVYRTINGKSLQLDAYRAAKPTGRVFIAIHGGGFTGGNKGGNTGELCQYLSQRGYTCFDINYRLQNDVGGSIQTAIDAAVDDASAAYNWSVANAAKYGGDPKRIAMGGGSAGAITTLFTTYSRNTPVKAVIDLWGGMYGKESDMKRGEAPLLIIHGRNDRTVAFSHATNLVNRAKSEGIKHKLLANESGHSIALGTRIEGKTLLEHIESFLNENL